jgi:hypothetical protein
VLIAKDARVFDEPPLTQRVEVIEPRPQYALWTDRFNNLLDVLKTRPLAELKAALFD